MRADRTTLSERWDKVAVGSSELLAQATNDATQSFICAGTLQGQALFHCLAALAMPHCFLGQMPWDRAQGEHATPIRRKIQPWTLWWVYLQDCAQKDCPDGNVGNAVCLWHATWTPDGSKVKEMVVFGGPYTHVKVLQCCCTP